MFAWLPANLANDDDDIFLLLEQKKLNCEYIECDDDVLSQCRQVDWQSLFRLSLLCLV